MRFDESATFASFVLTPEEVERGLAFTPENYAVMKNYRAEAAQEIVTFIVSDKTGTLQEQLAHARLKGQIDILNLLLANDPTLSK